MINQLKVKESEHNTGKNALDAALTEKRALAEELQAMREQMQRVDGMQQEVSVLQGALASVEERAVQALGALANDVGGEIARLQAQLAATERQLQAMEECLRETEMARDEAQSNAEEARQKLVASQLEAEALMAGLRDEVLAVQHEADAKVAAAKEEADAAKQRAEEQIEALKQEVKSQVQAAKEKESSLNDVLTGLRIKCSDLEMRTEPAASAAMVADRVSKTEMALKKMFPNRGALDGLDDSLESRLVAFYRQHNPNNVGRAWVLADQYTGNEDILNSMLRQTYNTDLEGMNKEAGGVLADLLLGLMEEERSEADRMLSHVKSIAEQLAPGGSLDAHTLSVQLLHGKEQRPDGLLEAGVVTASMLLMGTPSDAGRVGKGDLARWHEKVSKALQKMRGDAEKIGKGEDQIRAHLQSNATGDDHAADGGSSGNNKAAPAEFPDGGWAVWRRLCELVDECLERIAGQRSELRMDVELETKNQAQLANLRRKIMVLEQELNTARNRNSQANLAALDDAFRCVFVCVCERVRVCVCLCVCVCVCSCG